MHQTLINLFMLHQEILWVATIFIDLGCALIMFYMFGHFPMLGFIFQRFGYPAGIWFWRERAR